jgi:hypothetical protein
VRPLLGLGHDAGQGHSELLRLDGSAGALVHAEGVVSEAVPGCERGLPNCDTSASVEVRRLGVLDYPTRRNERLVDGLAGLLFGRRRQKSSLLRSLPADQRLGASLPEPRWLVDVVPRRTS